MMAEEKVDGSVEVLENVEVVEVEDKSASVCYYYNTPGGCWREKRCKYLHVRDETADSRPLCRFYGTSKKCWYGKDCYFKHVRTKPKKEEKAEKPSKKAAKSTSIKIGPDDNNNDKTEIDDSDKKPEAASDVTDPDKMTGEESEAKPEGKSDDKVPEEGATASPKPSKTDLTCGECGELFKDKKDLDACTALENHYVEMLSKADKEHVKIFRDNDSFTLDRAICGACGRVFQRPEDLLRHLGSKYKIKKEKHSHKDYFMDIVHQFVDRDTCIPYSDNEDDMLEELMILMIENYTGSSDEDDHCHCEETDGMSAYITHQLHRLAKLTESEIEEEGEERANNHGFTEDEVEDLLCQGIKPWDSEAHAALMVLNGGCSDYGFDSDY